MNIASYIALLRPRHWLKNVLLFFPVLFAGEMSTMEPIAQAALGFLCFSLVASAVYCFNDVYDAEADRLHPVKKNRPVASGAVRDRNAMLLAVVLLLLALGVGFYNSYDFGLVLLLYLAINAGYTLGLKKQAIVDITIIAIGFLLRIFAGGLLTDTPISHWLILMTFLLALFLALGKRRDDVRLLESSGQAVRASLKGYSLRFIDSALVLLGAVLVVAYVMYTLSPEVVERLRTDYPYLSSLPVVVGILRYLQVVLVHDATAEPTTMLLRDRFLQLMIALWLGTLVVLIYF